MSTLFCRSAIAPVLLGCGALLMLAAPSLAQAAGLRFSVTALSPAAKPTVVVTVSGVEVFNAQTAGFVIPVNTTGDVVIRMASLPDYQVFEGWTGVCAGLPPSAPCAFTAGLPQNYDAGAVIRNRTGTLRFTSSSVDEVRAPLSVRVNQASSPDGSTGEISVSTQASATPSTVVVGSYVFEPQPVSGACIQVGSPASKTAVVQEGLQTVVDLGYRTERCAVTAQVLGVSQGAVTSTPAGIDCPMGAVDPLTGSACSAFFPFRSQVRLTPLPKPGFAFAGWSGCFPTLQRECLAAAQQGSTKVAAFVAATTGFANLAVAASSIEASDAGGGRVRLAVTVRNIGNDAAQGTRLEFGSTAAGLFTEIPSIVSDGGSCNAVGFCSWDLGLLVPGASKTVSFTAGSTRTEFPMKACALSTTPDPDSSNDCAAATATLGAVLPPPGPALVTMGPVPPADRTALKSATDVPVLQFTAAPPAGATASYALTGISLSASGSGHDALDLVSVKIYIDSNGNGVVDAAERSLLVGSGRFDADNGAARIDFAASLLPSSRTYLVAVDLNSALAAAAALHAGGLAGAAGLALWGLAGGGRRRPAVVLTGLLAVGMLQVSCGGGSAAPAETRQYRLSLSEVRAQADGVAVGALGTPLAGAQLEVDR